MVLDLELHAEFSDHSVIEVGTIIWDNSLWNIIPTDKIVFEEPSHDVLGNKSK